MEESVRNAPEARPVNALVLYDPDVARRAKLGRAARTARTALAVWGALSLAGIGAAAVLHGTGGLDAFARPGETIVVTAANEERSQPVAKAVTPERAPAAVAAPSASPTRESAPLGDTAMAVPEDGDPSPGAISEPLESAAAPAEPDAAPAEPAEPIVLARLPRSRPKDIVVADSVARRDPAQIRWRIRKLHDLPLRYAYTPYHAYAAPPPRRMPPPLVYEW
jgi:hypothetical protein